MLNNLNDQSAALGLAQRIALPGGVTNFPVLSALPTAYWVSGDTGLKQTTTMAWATKTITVEELAAIVPIPENVLDDTDFDILAAVRPGLEAAIARAIDNAVFFGVNKPASFPTGVAPAALAMAGAANQAVQGTATAAQGGIAKDVSDLIGKLEAQGYYPDKGIASAVLRGQFRGLSALPQDQQSGANVSVSDWYGVDISYPMRGLWPTAVSTPRAIIGDFSQMVVGVRSDFRYKIATEGVINDNANAITYNLFQQDMVALRVTFRMGWQVANPINWDQPDPAKRYPFGVLVAPAT